MKENTKRVFDFLKENADGDYTAKDVAAALDLTDKQVNGIFTAAIQRKELGQRVESEIELSDGTHAKVKFLKLNEAGLAVDTDAE